MTVWKSMNELLTLFKPAKLIQRSGILWEIFTCQFHQHTYSGPDVCACSIPSLVMLMFFTPLNSLLWENNVKSWFSPCIPSVVDIIEDKTPIPQLFYHCHTIDCRTIMSGDLQLQRIKEFHWEVQIISICRQQFLYIWIYPVSQKYSMFVDCYYFCMVW